MGRGLDGYLDIRALALCGFEGPGRGGETFGFSSEKSPISPKAKAACGFSPVSNSFRWLWRGGNTSSHSEQSR